MKWKIRIVFLLLFPFLFCSLVYDEAKTKKETTLEEYTASLSFKYGFNLKHIINLAEWESSFHDDAVGADGEVGRFQIKLSTALDYDTNATIEKLKDPWYNTRISLLHLYAIKKYCQEKGYEEGSLMLAIFSVYNRGYKNQERAVKQGRKFYNRYAELIVMSNHLYLKRIRKEI